MKLNSVTVLTTFLFVIGITILPAQLLVFPKYSTSVDFTSVRCGSTTCIDVVGYANKDTTLTVTQAGLIGSANFSITTPTFPSLVNNRDSVIFRVCYTPTKSGVRDTSFLDIRLSATRTQRVVLIGNSISPVLFSSQNSIQFGVHNLNERPCKTITFYNAGDDTLTTLNLNLKPPFSGRVLGKQILPPKDSTTIEICFQPRAVSTYSVRDTITYSVCQPPLVLSLSGSGTGTPAPLLGGSLQLVPSPINFDTTQCRTTKCITFQIKNTGSQYSVLKRIEKTVSLPYTITESDVIVNDTVRVDSIRKITICYTPDGTRPIDRDTLIFRADTRQSLNICMLFDKSGSMLFPISVIDPTVRISAAKTSGVNFINQLSVDPQRGVVDTIAVQSFADVFTTNQSFTTNKNNCITAINRLSANGGTCLYDAIVSSTNALSGKSNPVIVLLSDGDNDCRGSFTDFTTSINACVRNNIKVFVICIADSTLQANKTYISELRQITNRTGGLLYAITDAKNLDSAYKDISRQLASNTVFSIPVVGRSASPNLTITPSPLRFDSIRIYTRQCKPVTIRNSGNASVFIEPSAFTISNSDFTIDTASLPRGILKPNESRVVDVCFSPTRIRRQTTAGNQISNLCNAPSLFALEGTGYDSIVVRFTNTITSRSGDTVFLPVILVDSLPKQYGVDSLQLRLEYQSTMLDTINTMFDISKGSAQTLSNRSKVNSIVLGDTMRVDFEANGNTISQETLNNNLLSIRLLMLEPSVTSSTITITNLKFADGNPKVGIIQPSVVNLDPTCFSHQRLLNTKRRRAQRTQLLMLMVQNGTMNGTVSSDVNYDSPTPSLLTIYDINGRKVGGYNLLINSKTTSFSYPVSLTNGIYTCVITTNDDIEPICTSLMYVAD
jgi:uncharacterized protein YegL